MFTAYAKLRTQMEREAEGRKMARESLSEAASFCRLAEKTRAIVEKIETDDWFEEEKAAAESVRGLIEAIDNFSAVVPRGNLA